MDTIDDDGQALGRFFDANEDVGPGISCGGQGTGENSTDEQDNGSEIAHQDLLGPAFSPHLQLTMPYCGLVCKVLAIRALETHEFISSRSGYPGPQVADKRDGCVWRLTDIPAQDRLTKPPTVSL